LGPEALRSVCAQDEPLHFRDHLGHELLAGLLGGLGLGEGWVWGARFQLLQFTLQLRDLLLVRLTGRLG
jgi:hypothetical protein